MDSSVFLLIALFASKSHVADAAWYTGGGGQSCTVVCANMAETCDEDSVAAMRALASEEPVGTAYPKGDPVKLQAIFDKAKINSPPPTGMSPTQTSYTDYCSGGANGNVQAGVPCFMKNGRSECDWQYGGGPADVTAYCADTRQSFMRVCCCDDCATSSGASVNGDPVTVFGGVERKFLLPLGQLTTLLQTKDLTVLASAFAGEVGDEQWIDQVIVDSAAGAQIVDVRIRRDIDKYVKHEHTPGSFETLDVRVPWKSAEPLSFPVNSFEQFHWGSMTLSGEPLMHPHNISVDIIRVDNPPSMNASAPRREGVLVMCDSVKLIIVSSSAWEYYWDDKDDNRAKKYSHLDFEIMDMKDSNSFTGLLPEVWGLKPPTNKNAFHNDQAFNDLHAMNRPTPRSTGNDETSALVCSGGQCSRAAESIV